MFVLIEGTPARGIGNAFRYLIGSAVHKRREASQSFQRRRRLFIRLCEWLALRPDAEQPVRHRVAGSPQRRDGRPFCRFPPATTAYRYVSPTHPAGALAGRPAAAQPARAAGRPLEASSAVCRLIAYRAFPSLLALARVSRRHRASPHFSMRGSHFGSSDASGRDHAERVCLAA
jgi:hypothetical protein